MTNPTSARELPAKWERIAERMRGQDDDGCKHVAATYAMAADDLRAALQAPARELPELPVVCHGMRRKGESAVIGVIPNKLAAKPPTAEWYQRDYEEVPLVLASDYDALATRLAESEARAEAAVAAEREACALICEDTWVEPGDMQTENCHEAAAKIRARTAITAQEAERGDE